MILGIYGAGGLGREIYEISLRRNAESTQWDRIVFIDDTHDEEDFAGTQIISFKKFKELRDNIECIIAVGEPALRERLFQKITNYGIKLATLIDTTAIISPSAKIASGTIVCEHATIHTGVEIDYNCLVQPFCTIGHDIKIGRHSVLSTFCAPGGASIFGDRVYVGMQATIKEKLTIGNDAIISMGAVVFRDVPAGATVVGNPARITRGNEEHTVFRI